MRLFGENGFTYHIEDQPFARDGEGSLHRIENQSGFVAKRVGGLRRRRPARGQNGPIVRLDRQLLSTQASIEVDVLHDGAGTCMGLVLSWVDFDACMAACYQRGRSLGFNEKLRIAQNLCRAVGNIHNAGYVVGDMNSQNILVERATARVFVKEVIRLGRGVTSVRRAAAEWLPSVCQGRGLSSGRTAAELQAIDNYGLAVHLFALFCRGKHPLGYHCGSQEKIAPLSEQRESTSFPAVIECIAGRRDRWNLIEGTIPIPHYRMNGFRFPSEMRDLFRRSFSREAYGAGSVPSPDEWLVALDAFERSLRGRLSAAIARFTQGSRPAAEGGDAEPAGASPEVEEALRGLGERETARLTSDVRLYRPITLAFAAAMAVCLAPGAPGMAAELLRGWEVWPGRAGTATADLLCLLAIGCSAVGLAACWFWLANRKGAGPIGYREYLLTFAVTGGLCLLVLAGGVFLTGVL